MQAARRSSGNATVFLFGKSSHTSVAPPLAATTSGASAISARLLDAATTAPSTFEDSHDSQRQKMLFGELPTIEDSVVRCRRDKGLVQPTVSQGQAF